MAPQHIVSSTPTTIGSVLPSKINTTITTIVTSVPSSPEAESAAEDRTSLALHTVADLIQQCDGNPSSAAISIALYNNALRHSPLNPSWFNRDRVVLPSSIEYVLHHLCGYEHVTAMQLKSYHAPAMLGAQSIANAVGLALATRQLAATYNKPNYDLIDNTTWCLVGDRCLQDRAAQEAISLAGRWGLGNLVVIYDNNSNAFTSEEVNSRIEACGWDVIEVNEGGSYDVQKLSSIFQQAGNAWKSDPRKKPTFINVKTDPDVSTSGSIKVVPEDVYEYFAGTLANGSAADAQWRSRLEKYSNVYPCTASELHSRIRGEISSEWKYHLPSVSSLPTSPTSTQNVSDIISSSLAQNVPTIFLGSSDCEHAQCAISDGIASFTSGTFIPITSASVSSYKNAAPAIRLATQQKLQCVHLTGEDGPTHQHDIVYIRPCDGTETLGAWEVALQSKNTSTLLSLSTQDVPQYLGWSNKDKVQYGAYVFCPSLNYSADEQHENTLSSTPSVVSDSGVEGPTDVTLIASGSEMQYAVATANLLEARGVRTRIVSFPSWGLFEQQSIEYKRSVMRKHEGIPAVVVAGSSSSGWERYADAAASANSSNVESLADRVEAFVGKFKSGGCETAIFEEI